MTVLPPFNANPCRLCKGPIGNRPLSAWYCWDCNSAPKKGLNAGRRAADVEDRRPLFVGGWRACKDCRVRLQDANRKAPGFVESASGDRRRIPLRCGQCNSVRTHIKAAIQRKALTAVARAVQKGLLPRASMLVCVDCGKQAEVYEHRHYGRPLQVEPVCQSCNRLRGPAVFPHPYCAYGAKPATPCPLCDREKHGAYFGFAIRSVHYCHAGIYVRQAGHSSIRARQAARSAR